MPPEAAAAVTATAEATDKKTQQTEGTTATPAAPAKADDAGKSTDAANAEKGSMVTDPEKEPVVDPSKDGDVKDPKEAKPVVPEKYELKLPEGSKLGDAYLAKVESLAKEKGWSNERAQEHVDEKHAAVSEYEQNQRQELQTLNNKTWKEELLNDPDFGGKNFEQNGHIAYKAAERFGGKEFADEMKAMQLNHHPKFFRFLVRVGRAMEPDQLVTTENKSTGIEPPEKRMYPNMFKTKE